MSNSSRLIDTFPLKTRKEYVRDRVQRGLVIKGRFPGVATYDKFYIFMGLDDKSQTAYGFFINSERNPLSTRKLFVLRAQGQIDGGYYSFLKNPDPSYIDAYAPYPFEFSDMITAFIECPSKICGNLSQLHVEEVIKVVQDNPTLIPSQKSLLAGTIILPPNFLA